MTFSIILNASAHILLLLLSLLLYVGPCKQYKSRTWNGVKPIKVNPEKLNKSLWTEN